MSQVATDHDYAAAVAWLVGRIDYERMLSVPYNTREFKLDRMRDLLARLGSPQDRLNIVHIGGTKGKGSTAAMIAGILTAAGLRTGLFTSPHLDQVEERLSVDGQDCPPQRLARLASDLRRVVDEMEAAGSRSDDPPVPTFFELTTALALMHFVAERVDAAVLEVGMGGRLDSTNVCRPLCTAITSISLDHTQQLGNTLAQIAWEKAGIVKPGVPLVCGVTDAEPREVIARVAVERGAPLAQLSTDFDFQYHAAHDVDQAAQTARIDFCHRRPTHRGELFGEREAATVHGPRPEESTSNGAPHEEPWRLAGLELGMWGRHQGANAAVALAVVDQLRALGWRISEEAIRRGLAAARCRARVELISRRPAVVVDAAHNVASIAALLEVLCESFAARRRRLIFGTSRDKDARGMLAALLPKFDAVVLTRYRDNPRGMPAEDLAALADELGCRSYQVCAEPSAAWDAARRDAGPDELILATGSFFIAAEVRRLLVG